MKVPKDKGLVLGIFYSVSLAIILLAWIFLPPMIRHEEDEDKPKILKPEEAILSAEEILTQAEEVLAQIEKAQEEKAQKERTSAGKPESSKIEDKK